MAAAAVFAAFLATAVVMVPLPPPPPPGGSATAFQQQLLVWRPAAATCVGQAIDITPVRHPTPTLTRLNPQQARSIGYHFAINAAGRTMSIAREDADFTAGVQDIGPSLAASQFPVGAPRRDCYIRYEPDTKAPSDAAPDDLAAYSVLGATAALPKAGWERFAPSGDCRTSPRPGVLLRAYPDFSKLAATPGVKTWSLVTYDLDAEGKPLHIRAAGGSGDAALDAAATEAVAASRFSGGARTGCLYPYWRAPGTLAAPEQPGQDTAPMPPSTCPDPIDWAIQPNSVYPLAYRNRAIEGWAVLSFDLAPWGEVGNVQVVDAQPSADFGQQAIQTIKSGRAAPSPQGATACMETVRFRMPGQRPEKTGSSAESAPAEDEQPGY